MLEGSFDCKLPFRGIDGEPIQHNGKLIKDLMAAVEKAEQAASLNSAANCSAAFSNQDSTLERNSQPASEPISSQPEQLSQPLGLGPADWNLALLFIVHAQLVRALEPGHDFANAVNVHQVGTVRAPEQSRVETRQ